MKIIPQYIQLTVARRKGIQAAKAGKSIMDNPYPTPTDRSRGDHSRDPFGAWVVGYMFYKERRTL